MAEGGMDAAYLKATVGDALADAMAAAVIARPDDLTTFIASYLEKYVEVQQYLTEAAEQKAAIAAATAAAEAAAVQADAAREEIAAGRAAAITTLKALAEEPVPEPEPVPEEPAPDAEAEPNAEGEAEAQGEAEPESEAEPEPEVSAPSPWPVINPQVFPALCEAVVQRTGFSAAYIAEVSYSDAGPAEGEEGEEAATPAGPVPLLTYVCASEADGFMVGQTLPGAGISAAACAAKGPKSVAVANVLADDSTTFFKMPRFGAYACAPVIGFDRAVCYVLCADTLAVGGPLVAADLEFLEAIATAISPGKKPLPLRPQPAEPLARVVIVEAAGGIDKRRDGHRVDTVPIGNAIIERGCACELLLYTDSGYDAARATLEAADAIVVRIVPAAYDGVSEKLDELVEEMAAAGKAVFSRPGVVDALDAKEALAAVGALGLGAADCVAYRTPEELQAAFAASVATGPRVLKQNLGAGGRGVWVCRVAEGQEGEVGDETVLSLQEAVDNHTQEMTVVDFLSYCVNEEDADHGGYFHNGNFVVDQKFHGRIAEGEVRVTMVGETPGCIVVKTPAEGSISATLQTGAQYKEVAVDAEEFAPLVAQLAEDVPKLMAAIGKEGEALPLVWTVDLVADDKEEGAPDVYKAGEFDCACIGISQHQHLIPAIADTAVAAAKVVAAAAAAAATAAAAEVEAEAEAKREADLEAQKRLGIIN